MVAEHDENTGHASAEIAHQPTDKCIEFLHIRFLHGTLHRYRQPPAQWVLPKAILRRVRTRSMKHSD
jgi:hypothetical protein